MRENVVGGIAGETSFPENLEKVRRLMRAREFGGSLIIVCCA